MHTHKPEFSKSAKRKNSSAQEQVRTKLTKGLLGLIVLQLLEAKQMHEYEMIRRIRGKFGLTLPLSTIYPILETLVTRGYITKNSLEGESIRKVYGLTKKGLRFLGFNDASRNFVCGRALLAIVMQRHDHLTA